ncbi:uncharacterized protein LOC113235959 [Hyposmocoma kahamanoa]|uniref:uncharacterized protein LOC113235959 n=1 Tax=Hyposmocoma kahamanoa TaxID=1477025 RepID=UPI000E6D6C25|nr:uncharacterized protein LOC113235959 [Hyposmocoma kahamanoa]
MTFRLAVYVQLVLLFVQYASLQLQYNYYTENYYGNYNNPGYYQNSMLNYRYANPTTESNNDLTEEEAPERLFSVEIQQSRRHRKRNKKKKNKYKNKPYSKDIKGCESEYNSPECKSGDEGGSTECKECTCSECGPNNSNQNSCCPNYCEQCVATQPPGIAIMAYPINFQIPLPVPMPYPSSKPDDCTTDPSTSTTDNSRTTESTQTTDLTTANTKDSTVETTHTTGDSNETTHTTDHSNETTHTTDHWRTSTSTTIKIIFPDKLMESTSFPIFKSTTPRSTTTTYSTTISTRITPMPMNSMERKRQAIRFEQYPYPISHRRPYSDHYQVSSNKKDKISPMYHFRQNTDDDERDIRMIVVKDRQLYDRITDPPNRMLVRPHRNYEDEMQSRNDFRARYDAKRYPHFPSRRDSPHKKQRYGILPLPDELATKLLLKLRTMKELNTNDKNIPQIRKLKQK